MNLPTLPDLRQYQRDGIARMRAVAAELRRDRGAGDGYGILAVAPTGAGKTRVALEIATAAIAKGGRVLWVAPRTELVDQPAAKLAEYGWTATRIVKAGRAEGDLDAPITIASIQTLVAREHTPPADVIIFDEARHYVAPDWSTIAGAYRASVRIGLDATPARADGSALGDLFDAIVPISSVAELTALGWLVPSVVYAPDAPQRDLSSSPLDAYRERAPGSRALVFCASRRHARDVAAEFTAAGVPAEYVDANTHPDVRRAALDRVRSGETRVLCNVLLFTEGLDLVELDTVIIARGVSHESTWLQIGGRALRPSPHTGKTRAAIIDLRGHVHRFGLLDDERTWHLDGKPIRRLEALPPVSQCPFCHSWHRGGGHPCPACGAMLPPPKPPKISKRALKEIAREQIPRVGPEWEAWVQLVEAQIGRGYKPQWAALRFRERFSRWPRWSVEQVVRERTGGRAA